MAIKENREYRNLGILNIEKREEQDAQYVVEGYASTFEPYHLFSDGDYEFYEEIDPKAFDEADMSDVVFLRDHTGTVLARTKNGSIELSIDSHGLKSRTDLGLTERSREMYEDIAVKNYTQMSFSFVVEDDELIISGDRATRHINKIGKVYDISAVAFPANPTTDIGLSYRSAFDGVIKQREAERLIAEKRARDLEKLRLKLKLVKEMHHGN